MANVEMDKKPEKPKLTWAQMARTEGHVPRLPGQFTRDDDPDANPTKYKRSENYYRVVDIVKAHGPIKASKIMEMTGLTKPVVSGILNRCKQIVNVGDLPAGKNRSYEWSIYEYFGDDE